MNSIIKTHCYLNKCSILRKVCGNQGNSFPKEHLRFQRFLWGSVNPHMDYIILDILLKVVNYNIHEKFSLWRYSFHEMLLHTPMCVYLTRSSEEGRIWKKIFVLPLSFYGHKVSYYFCNFQLKSDSLQNWEKNTILGLWWWWFNLSFLSFCKEAFLFSYWFMVSGKRIKYKRTKDTFSLYQALKVVDNVMSVGLRTFETHFQILWNTCM